MADTVANNTKRKIVGCAAVGDPPPPKKLKKNVETLRFQVHNFASREEVRGKFISTPQLEAHGYQWKLNIYPRGDNKSSENTEYVSVFLNVLCDVESAPFVKATFRCKTCTASTGISKRFHTGRGWKNYCKRDKLLAEKLDENGTLTIDVDIQLAQEEDAVWYPEEVYAEPTVQKALLEYDHLADVKFSVADKHFVAHSLILATRCRRLYELVEATPNCNETIKISGVSRKIFQILLDYIYTVSQPEMVTLDDAKEVLDAANCFGITNLKMLAESTIVDKFLDATSAAGLLLYADAKTCPLLKDACMELHSTDPDEVEASDDWQLVEDSKELLCELLKYPRFKQKCLQHKSNEDTDSIQYLSVGTLRERLEEANLDLDGTRDMLVDRLKAHVGTDEDESD